MRCTSHFKISELIKHFKDMPGYTEEVLKPLITQLTTEAYKIILKQHDMLFRCVCLYGRRYYSCK